MEQVPSRTKLNEPSLPLGAPCFSTQGESTGTKDPRCSTGNTVALAGADVEWWVGHHSSGHRNVARMVIRSRLGAPVAQSENRPLPGASCQLRNDLRTGEATDFEPERGQVPSCVLASPFS